MKPLRYIWLFLTIILFAVSCSTPRELAVQFITEENNVNVLILPPSGIIKNYYPINPDSIPEGSSREFELEDGQFLHQIIDSLVIRNFMETISRELSRFDVNVYTPENIDSFLQLESNAHIFSIAQIQLMEYLDESLEFTMYDTTVYEAETEITTLVFNTWFEYTMPNEPEANKEVLFSMQYRSDYIEGEFTRDWLSGEVAYEYRPYRLLLDDVYDLSLEAAQQNAQYIFDFLLNQYIIENMSSEDRHSDYYQYDRLRHMIRPANDDRFFQYPSSEEDSDQEL